jgi:lipid-A-disaccharide synthase-like uncharacterized protein
MNHILFSISAVSITPWTIIGLLGSFLFTGRWIIQVISSRAHGKPVVTELFWYMSISGSILLLFYFIFGARDLVGILSNLFPSLIAAYNLFLERKSKPEPNKAV